ncbi:hypothetical protein Tco_0089028 [Tanacetum coccineum]
MVEPKKSLKKKDQIAFDEEVSRRLEATYYNTDWKKKKIKLCKTIEKAVEQRSKLPTKAQMRNRMCTYLKNMDSEVVKGSEASIEESSKIAGDELESDKSEKQKRRLRDSLEVGQSKAWVKKARGGL